MAQQHRGDFMGNGKGLDPLAGLQITEDDLNNMIGSSVTNFGSPNTILVSPQVAKTFYQRTGFYVQPNPQYNGTEWAYLARLTKREHAIAKLQCFLMKFKLQKHLEDEEERRKEAYAFINKLKTAKWATYKRNKVQSSP